MRGRLSRSSRTSVTGRRRSPAYAAPVKKGRSDSAPSAEGDRHVDEVRVGRSAREWARVMVADDTARRGAPGIHPWDGRGAIPGIARVGRDPIPPARAASSRQVDDVGRTRRDAVRGTSATGPAAGKPKGTQEMRSFARRHPLAVFLAIATRRHRGDLRHPASCPTAGIGVIDLDLPGVAPFILLSALSPWSSRHSSRPPSPTAAAASASCARRVFNFRVSPGWYVLAILLLPVAAMATAIVVGGVDVLAAVVGDPVAVLATHRRGRGPRLRARQLVGRGGLDRLRSRAAPAPAGPGRAPAS